MLERMVSISLAQPFFIIRRILFLVGGRGAWRGFVVAAGEQIAVIIDDGDAVGSSLQRRRQ